jgi:hypothetical protein
MYIVSILQLIAIRPSDVDIDDGTICMTSPVIMVMKSFDNKMFHTLVEEPCDVDNLTISRHD